MLWLSILGFLWGAYEIFLGAIGVFLINNLEKATLNQYFGLYCVKGPVNFAEWKDPD